MTENKHARYERLVMIYANDLYRYAVWLSKSTSIGEDLVQETCLRAWKSLDQLTDENRTKAWLFTILRRENARRFERKQLDMVDDAEISNLPEQISDYDTSDMAFNLRNALAQISADYREPLLLQIIGGFSCDEIAQQLQISSEAVMTRLSRARKKLRGLLTEVGDHG